MAYEYKVVPAPGRGEKAKGLKTPAERFAHALELAMNDLGRDGWEYIGADTLPSEERSGFTGRTTVYHNVLVFRRPVDGDDPAQQAEHDQTGLRGRGFLSLPRLRMGASKAERVAPPLTAPPDAGPRVGPATGDAPPPRLGPAGIPPDLSHGPYRDET